MSVTIIDSAPEIVVDVAKLSWADGRALLELFNNKTLSEEESLQRLTMMIRKVTGIEDVDSLPQGTINQVAKILGEVVAGKYDNGRGESAKN